MSNNKEDKEMDGYSFEAVNTERSQWEIYKALVKVRSMQKHLHNVSLL